MSDTIQDALQKLSEAHGPSALAAAFDALQYSVRKQRRADRQESGQLAQTFKVAMRQWDAQKAAGATRVELAKNLENTLRASWPQTREWKYLCERCNDYGLVIYDCLGDSACGRDNPHRPHDYGIPCHCSRGARFTDKPKLEGADITKAGKSKKLTQTGR